VVRGPPVGDRCLRLCLCIVSDGISNLLAERWSLVVILPEGYNVGGSVTGEILSTDGPVTMQIMPVVPIIRSL
jgi:hypothetical protein